VTVLIIAAPITSGWQRSLDHSSTADDSQLFAALCATGQPPRPKTDHISLVEGWLTRIPQVIPAPGRTAPHRTQAHGHPPTQSAVQPHGKGTSNTGLHGRATVVHIAARIRQKAAGHAFIHSFVRGPGCYSAKSPLPEMSRGPLPPLAGALICPTTAPFGAWNSTQASWSSVARSRSVPVCKAGGGLGTWCACPALGPPSKPTMWNSLADIVPPPLTVDSAVYRWYLSSWRVGPAAA
jgi:hypothetical protein